MFNMIIRAPVFFVNPFLKKSLIIFSTAATPDAACPPAL
jgi:hypothetical protein